MEVWFGITLLVFFVNFLSVVFKLLLLNKIFKLDFFGCYAK